MTNQKALVLLSGGQDSTTCLHWAIDKFGKENVKALNIFYSQRHEVEIQAARKIVQISGIGNGVYMELNLDFISKICDSALFNSAEDINKPHIKNSNLPASFVPGRNILFLTVAAAIAYTHDIRNIITGVCQTDFSGYPDCRDNTIKSLQVTLSLAMDTEFVIHTPLMWMTKAETVILASHLPGCFKSLSYSHTCYEGKIPPCGKCPACKLRAKGFNEAGYDDPLIVRLREEKK